jgi:hypothetical protein
LCLIFLLMIALFFLENFVWPEYLLFIFSPWFVFLGIIFGIYSKKWNNTRQFNRILTICLLFLTIFFFLIKLSMLPLYRLERSISGVLL